MLRGRSKVEGKGGDKSRSDSKQESADGGPRVKAQPRASRRIPKAKLKGNWNQR